jgi:hypothetical protein
MERRMPIGPDPKIPVPNPVPLGPKKPLPGRDANFPGQPPFADIEGDGDNKRRGKIKRPGRHGEDEASQDLEIDRGEPGHVESAENVERDLPLKNETDRR